MAIEVEIIDNSIDFTNAVQEKINKALEMCGLVAEGYAKKLCPVDTGNLRNSITHAVVPSENAVYIGTNSEYGAYVELGTGIYYPGGRQTPWSYKDEKGEWHRTNGQRPQPFLKPAIADHAKQYTEIVESTLKSS